MFPDNSDHSTTSESTGSNIEINYEDVDVTDYPDDVDSSLFPQHTLNLIEITGDLHGNVIRRIFDLVRCGFIVVDREHYAQLFSNDKKIRYAAFNAICENLKVNPDCHSKEFWCSGDGLSERDRLFSDGATLRLDDACLEKGLQTQFIMGNHELEFYSWFYQVLSAPENSPIEKKYKYTGTFNLGQNQSLVNFSQELIDHFSGKNPNPTLDKWEEWVIRRLAHSILFSSKIVLTLSGEPILINSKHSRAGIQTFMLVADWLNSLSQEYGLPYISYKKNDILNNPNALPQLAADVNRTFRLLLLTEEKGKLKIRLEGLRAFVTSYQAQKTSYIQSKNEPSLRFNGYYFCPLYSLLWERHSCSPHDELPSKIGKIRTIWTNGHIGEGKPKDTRETECNLDSKLCKAEPLLIEHLFYSIACWVTQSIKNIPNAFNGIVIIYNLDSDYLALYHASHGQLKEEILFKEGIDYSTIHRLLFADEDFFEGKTLLTKTHIDVLCGYIKSESIRRLVGNTTLLSINSTLNNAACGASNSWVREVNLNITDTTITCQYYRLYPSETCPIDANNPYFNELTRQIDTLQKFSEEYTRHYNLNRIHNIIQDKNKTQILTRDINAYLLRKRQLFECLLDACTDKREKLVFLDLNHEIANYPTLSITDATYLYLDQLTTLLKLNINILSLPTDSKLNIFKKSIEEELSWFENELQKEKPEQANFFEIKRREAVFRNFLQQIKESLCNISSIALTHFDQPPIATLTNWIDKTVAAIETFLKIWNQPTELTFSYNSTFSTEQNECKLEANLL